MPQRVVDTGHVLTPASWPGAGRPAPTTWITSFATGDGTARKQGLAGLAAGTPVMVSWQEPDPDHSGQLLCGRALIHDIATRPADTTRLHTRGRFTWFASPTRVERPVRRTTARRFGGQASNSVVASAGDHEIRSVERRADR
ncbi:hypothetical protein [Kitasatospora sp. NPDC056184]|uniref:hypothetical protein n=1 Tax=Kitasatospora sp. NPDC056184 TaxID=3345738 RepID=UPI0035D7172F